MGKVREEGRTRGSTPSLCEAPRLLEGAPPFLGDACPEPLSPQVGAEASPTGGQGGGGTAGGTCLAPPQEAVRPGGAAPPALRHRAGRLCHLKPGPGTPIGLGRREPGDGFGLGAREGENEPLGPVCTPNLLGAGGPLGQGPRDTGGRRISSDSAAGLRLWLWGPSGGVRMRAAGGTLMPPHVHREARARARVCVEEGVAGHAHKCVTCTPREARWPWATPTARRRGR